MLEAGIPASDSEGVNKASPSVVAAVELRVDHRAPLQSRREARRYLRIRGASRADSRRSRARQAGRPGPQAFLYIFAWEHGIRDWSSPVSFNKARPWLLLSNFVPTTEPHCSRGSQSRRGVQPGGACGCVLHPCKHRWPAPVGPWPNAAASFSGDAKSCSKARASASSANSVACRGSKAAAGIGSACGPGASALEW
jgi:hypothetical protein